MVDLPHGVSALEVLCEMLNGLGLLRVGDVLEVMNGSDVLLLVLNLQSDE